MGGAICIAGGSATISNSTFAANVATGGNAGYASGYGTCGGRGMGGALTVSNAEVAIVNSTISGNQAVGGAGSTGAFSGCGGQYGLGGAVHCHTGQIYFVNCTLTQNDAIGGPRPPLWLNPGSGLGGAAYNYLGSVEEICNPNFDKPVRLESNSRAHEFFWAHVF